MKRSESTALGQYLTEWDNSLTFDQVLDLLKYKGSDDDTPDDFDQRKELLTIHEDYEYDNGRELVEKIKNTAASIKDLDTHGELVSAVRDWLEDLKDRDQTEPVKDQIKILKKLLKKVG